MNEDKEFFGINVIPLVDIMLVLLTIVLTTATFIVQGTIPVKLPEAETGERIKKVEEIQIVITEEGKYYFRGKEIKELEGFFKNLNRESIIRIISDRNAKVEALVKVLDLVNKYQFKNVLLTVRIR